MKRWLVVYPSGGGMAELCNVGVFMAATDREAIAIAKLQWRTVADLRAYDIEELDAWSYFT